MRALAVALTLSFLAATVCTNAAAGTAEENLKQKNITLPPPSTPVANYVPAVRVGNLLFVSGTGPSRSTPRGKVGAELTLEQGYQAARSSGLNILATVRATLGSLDRVKRVVKVLGMVNSAPGFTDQPKVINGFSSLPGTVSPARGPTRTANRHCMRYPFLCWLERLAITRLLAVGSVPSKSANSVIALGPSAVAFRARVGCQDVLLVVCRWAHP